MKCHVSVSVCCVTFLVNPGMASAHKQVHQQWKAISWRSPQKKCNIMIQDALSQRKPIIKLKSYSEQSDKKKHQGKSLENACYKSKQIKKSFHRDEQRYVWVDLLDRKSAPWLPCCFQLQYP